MLRQVTIQVTSFPFNVVHFRVYLSTDIRSGCPVSLIRLSATFLENAAYSHEVELRPLNDQHIIIFGIIFRLLCRTTSSSLDLALIRDKISKIYWIS